MSNLKSSPLTAYEWNVLNGTLPKNSSNLTCVDSAGNVYVAVNLKHVSKSFLVKTNMTEGNWETIGLNYDGIVNCMCIDSNDTIYMAGTICDSNSNPMIVSYSSNGNWLNYSSNHNDIKHGGILGMCCNKNNQLFIAGNKLDDGMYYIYEYDADILDWRKAGKGFENSLWGVSVNESACIMAFGSDNEKIPFVAVGYSDTDWLFLSNPEHLDFGKSVTFSENNFFLTLANESEIFVAIATPSTTYDVKFEIHCDLKILPASIPLNGGTGIYSILVDTDYNIFVGGDFGDQNNLCYVAKSNMSGESWTDIGASNAQSPIISGENCIRSICASKTTDVIYISGSFDFVNYGKNMS